MPQENYFKNGKVYIWKETFAIVKAKNPCLDAFANIIDKSETTVIIEQTKISNNDIIEINNDWKILTFDMVLPFQLVGFLAEISQALANANISIFAISAYSTDHILVKQENLDKARKKLEELGFNLENKF